MRQQGRILGIGGIFFKSAQQQPMREWYAQHLGLADSGHGVMLPWREHDHPDHEQMTVWSIFPGDTTYFAVVDRDGGPKSVATPAARRAQ